MSIETMFENVYHQNILRELKTDEEKDFECIRHERALKNINERIEELEKI